MRKKGGPEFECLCTNTVVYFDWKTPHGNLYLRLRKMSHTIYAANGKVRHIRLGMCE